MVFTLMPSFAHGETEAQTGEVQITVDWSGDPVPGLVC
jgi:hypothetical protein